jgi:hypothetical protein
VSYTALRLAARVAANEGYGAQIWIGIGDQPRLMDTQSKPAALERS